MSEIDNARTFRDFIESSFGYYASFGVLAALGGGDRSARPCDQVLALFQDARRHFVYCMVVVRGACVRREGLHPNPLVLDPRLSVDLEVENVVKDDAEEPVLAYSPTPPNIGRETTSSMKSS